MLARSAACHVAVIKRVHGGRTYRYALLRRTYRQDGKVKHQTLGNLSRLPQPVIDTIRRAVRGETLVSPDDAFGIERTRPHGHVVAVLGTMRKLGIETLLGSRPDRMRDLCMAMIAARVLDPRSKLATSRAMRTETLSSTLGEGLRVADCDEDDLYEAMDWLLPRQRRIEDALAKRHMAEGTLALYDLTSTYFEGRKCPLARLGHNRDGKKGKLQIVLGLLCDGEGRPVAVEVFEGNTGDPKTVASQVQKLRGRFGLKRVVLVGDRGMLTSARIREDLANAQGMAWITALRAPAIAMLVSGGSLQLSLFDTKDMGEISSPAYPGERLVVCRNPLLADERARKRKELLAATERELDKVAAATKRDKRRLKDKAKIALRVGRVLGRFKMKKHFRLVIEEESFRYQRDEERIAREAALDGIYVIRTSVPAKEMASDRVVHWYKRLAVVERAFRSLKTVDLHVRPINHRKADRVRAHVLICMLAYYVEWHMRRALEPMLFDDDDNAAAEASRTSVVAPATRSARAQRKAASKRTDDGMPVHSFQTLLADLATIAKNRVRLKAMPETPAFDIVTTPTPIQQRAYDLLGVSPTP